MVITTYVYSGEVRPFLESKAEAIMGAIRAEMTAATVNLLAYIKEEKLSGQVLNRRTGALSRSGFTSVEETGGVLTGTVGFGSVGAAGSTVPYAAIHNYGGTIDIPEVTGKLMVFERDGKTIFTTKHKAFTVIMPARNYMESSLAEKQGEIEAGFQEAVTVASAK